MAEQRRFGRNLYQLVRSPERIELLCHGFAYAGRFKARCYQFCIGSQGVSAHVAHQPVAMNRLIAFVAGLPQEALAKLTGRIDYDRPGQFNLVEKPGFSISRSLAPVQSFASFPAKPQHPLYIERTCHLAGQPAVVTSWALDGLMVALTLQLVPGEIEALGIEGLEGALP
ncbi:MAG: hypothetical protein RBQ99_11255 [Trichlorobacter sp.]|jgi:hypothetical protein|nr:hypothetical protein [Trichlorobacter sp.]